MTTFTGELKVASQMQADESEVSVPKLKKFRQRKREVQCAVNLVQKLQPFLDLKENEEVGGVLLVHVGRLMRGRWLSDLHGNAFICA
jgi:hypothetical protein